ncbi:MAG TPA: DUF3035 domain-containing protein [Vitreimonas sp.]|uniref:DUF3035 domain-containing protein n=1 Tax=Vitreimonas sp. TaxID=3069702 RepID=UPI002D4B4F15|nr:DUF3035 domain-containing protein [Vitreimonas sp.]HYD86486.1 DUF3035 domain-containing protein [Vitreimonas sp.]
MSKLALMAVLAAATAASGCASVSRAIGATKTSPDEFRVVTQAPLTLPPDYNLRPPRPGEPRPSEIEPTQEARTALFGETTGAAASQGERTLVAAAGATAADPEIRDTIDFESQGVVRRSEGFVDRLLAFGGSSAPRSAPLNAEEEARRLQDDEAIRRATGGGQVVIERDRGGFKLPGT